MNIAHAYAQALYEFSVERNKNAKTIQSFRESLQSFAKLIENSKELKVALLGLATSLKEKEKIVSALLDLLKLEPPISYFLKLLARKGRLNLLTKIQTEIKRVSCESTGGILGELVAADKLSEQEISELQQIFSQKLGKKVQFEIHQNPDLLAGLKVTLDGVTYDGSLRSELSRLKEGFIHGEEKSAIFDGNNGLGNA